MTTVVVFGGTEFLGRRLVHRLAAAVRWYTSPAAIPRRP